MNINELAQLIYSELKGIDKSTLTEAELNILRIIKPFLKKETK